MTNIENFAEAQSRKRLALEQKLIPINREISDLKLRLSELCLKRDRMEVELLGKKYHAMQTLIRAGRELDW